LLPPEMVNAETVGDAEQPTAEFILFAVIRQRPNDAQEGFLKQISRLWRDPAATAAGR